MRARAPPSFASTAASAGASRVSPAWRPATRASARASAGLRVSTESFMRAILPGAPAGRRPSLLSRFVTHLAGPLYHVHDAGGGLPLVDLVERHPPCVRRVAARLE